MAHSREESAATTTSTGFANLSAIAHYAVNNRARAAGADHDPPALPGALKRKAELDGSLNIPKLWRRTV
jgi:hypothetical protein